MKKKSPKSNNYIIYVSDKPISHTLDGVPLGLMPSGDEMGKVAVRKAEAGYEHGEWEW